jgi:hypothetical protein
VGSQTFRVYSKKMLFAPTWGTAMKILRPEEVTTFPAFRELSPEELKEAYALARAAFTADDLQRYTEVEEGVSAEKILAEMEEVQKQADQEKG